MTKYKELIIIKAVLKAISRLRIFMKSRLVASLSLSAFLVSGLIQPQDIHPSYQAIFTSKLKPPSRFETAQEPEQEPIIILDPDGWVDVDALQADLVRLRERVAELEEENRGLKAELAERDRRLAVQRTEIEDVQAANEFLNDLKGDFEKELRDLREKLTAKDQLIQDRDAELAREIAAKEEAKTKLQGLEDSLREKEAALEEASGEVRRLEALVGEKETELSGLRQDSGRLAVVTDTQGRELEEKERNLGKIRLELAEATTARDLLVQEIDALKAEIRRLEGVIVQKVTKIAQLEGELRDAGIEREALQTQVVLLEQKTRDLEALQLANDRLVGENKALKERVTALEEEGRKKDARIKELGRQTKDAAQLSADIESGRAELRKIQETIAQKEVSLQQAIRDLEEFMVVVEAVDEISVSLISDIIQTGIAQGEVLDRLQARLRDIEASRQATGEARKARIVEKLSKLPKQLTPRFTLPNGMIVQLTVRSIPESGVSRFNISFQLLQREPSGREKPLEGVGLSKQVRCQGSDKGPLHSIGTDIAARILEHLTGTPHRLTPGSPLRLGA